MRYRSLEQLHLISWQNLLNTRSRSKGKPKRRKNTNEQILWLQCLELRAASLMRELWVKSRGVARQMESHFTVRMMR